MRLAPWETVPRAADARPRHRLPELVGGGMNCAPGLLAPRCAPRTACRFVAGGADHPTILRAVPSFHEARQKALSRFVRTPARRMLVGPLLSLRGNFGEMFSMLQSIFLRSYSRH